MGHDMFAMIIRFLGEFYILLVLLRFLLQMSHADFYNPISQAIARLTHAPLLPIRSVLPPIARRDFSALVLALLLQLALYSLVYFLMRGTVPILPILMSSVISVLYHILDIYFYTVIAAVIISWIAPGSYHPAPQLILQLTEPVFNLFRKVIPPFGGLDLSPIFIFLAIQVIQWQLRPFLLW